MEIINIFLKASTLLFNPTSLVLGALVFGVSFALITLVYKSPRFRKFFQGPDSKFLITKTADLIEAISFLNMEDLTSAEKKKIAECLSSVKKPIEELLVKL